MLENSQEKIETVLNTLSVLGKSAAVTQVQSIVVPYVMEVFTEHDHTTLEKMILMDYDLVAQKTPPGVRQTLNNVGSSPKMRQQWQGLITQQITPQNILLWLKNPDEWLNAEDADEQREELQKCAEVIESTPGGEEWLARQVFEVYKMAGIAPEDSTGETAEG